jgi:hypothetical protein
MKAAIGLKGRSIDHGSKLWKQYKGEGLSSFLELKYTPQQSPLKGKKKLLERLSGKGFSTIKEAQSWIMKTYQISYTENGLGNYFLLMGMKRMRLGQVSISKLNRNGTMVLCQNQLSNSFVVA